MGNDFGPALLDYKRDCVRFVTASEPCFWLHPIAYFRWLRIVARVERLS